MEYFDGAPLKNASPENLKFIQKITETFTNVANKIGYFYTTTSLDSIKVSGETLKFTHHNDFIQVTGWSSYLGAYENLYKFFTKLASLLPNKNQWISKLDAIFNLRSIAESYHKSSHDQKTALEETCKSTFNLDLLKSVLDKAKTLFTPAV